MPVVGFFGEYANAKLLKTHVNIQFYPNNILWSACFVPFDHLFPSFPLVRLLVKWSFYKSNISNSKSHRLKDRSLKRTKVLTRIWTSVGPLERSVSGLFVFIRGEPFCGLIGP